MPALKTITFEAECGCEVHVPVVSSTEPASRGLGFRLRVRPADGLTWDDVAETLTEPCDACILP